MSYFSRVLLLGGLTLSAILPASSTSSQNQSSERISPLSSAEVAAFKPYTQFANAAYCQPSTTLAWNCGASCSANPTFMPVASGGDGAVTQFWYVGFDPALGEAIVAHQGTDATKILADVTDAEVKLTSLNATLFPGVGHAISVHTGFAGAQSRSAHAVLNAVNTTLGKFGTSKVTVVGHSLGGAIALLDSIYLSLHLPSNVTVRMVSYGMPRVGNKAFADFVDARGRPVTHITNKHDIVPIVPPIAFGYHHPSGEVHIDLAGTFLNCPGQDNPSGECSTGSTSLFTGSIVDHIGPYDGVEMGCLV